MNAPFRPANVLSELCGLVDDRPADQVFQLDRRMFTDPQVYEAEMRYVFERTWNYVGLESQLRRPHDFLTTHVGRQPVLLTRDKDGRLGGFLNTCRHRGTVVCPFKHGRQKFHVCRYHGWAYDSGGRNVSITEQGAGHYPTWFDDADHDLVPVSRLASYRGFIFASLSPDVPPLEEHLGDARIFLDLVIDQSPTGELEIVPGEVSYTFDANWKLQFENGLDYYHFASTHSSYVDILKRRKAAGSGAGFTEEPEGEENGQGSFNFAYGHAVNWSVKSTQLYGRPLGLHADTLAEVRARVGPDRVKWMLRQRNLTIFPNLQVIDIQSAQLRTWQPLAAGRTEMSSHCLAPVGESAEARALRIRNYEDFFNPTGLASSDDNVMYEFCQTGYEAEGAGPTQGYLRGVAAETPPASRHAAELGFASADSAFGTVAFGGETNFYPGYREWSRLMRAAMREA